jgi:hypothetical protein
VFLAGARTAFRGLEPAPTRAAEASIAPVQRPFFWEGHALGASARHAFAFAAGNPGDRYQAPGFRFMFYTGIGFWNGLAADYGVPAVSLDPARWTDVDDFLGCRPLIAGGESFAVTTVLGRIDPERIARLDRPEVPWWRHGLYQGVGRAAWFLYMQHPGRLARCLSEAGDDATALAEGLGLAITYTQLSRPAAIVPAIEALPEAHRAAARAGSRLCLAAAAADDARLGDALAALPAPLPHWLELGTAALEHAGRGAEMAPSLSAALHGLT